MFGKLTRGEDISKTIQIFDLFSDTIYVMKNKDFCTMCVSFTEQKNTAFSKYNIKVLN